ncbi:hypothetical protein [Sorangium sp. So ce117]|uniref:hypothetical protein n=1 Tax=Sorangium sp. So ce117 TaxID=3133277 RepID=UPI003F5D6ECF
MESPPCAGLSREDAPIFFEVERATPESVFQKLAATEPTTGFGETFQYSNSMASAMHAGVFGPLGIRWTTAR